MNVEVAVVVAKMFPTVSCVPVAIREPLPSVVITEFAAPENDVPFIVTVVTEPKSDAVTPPPTKLNVVLAGREDPSSCTKLYPPLPVPRHVPLTETHPPVSAKPPANVDVDVFVTVRLVSVVVPNPTAPVVLIVVFVIEPPVIAVLVIDPPVIDGLDIAVPLS